MPVNPQHKDAIDKFVGSHNGKPLDKQALLKPNPVIAKALIARMASMNAQQAQSLKSIINPQTKDALKTLLPELGPLIDKGVANGTAG